jgi:hypothetical protein
MSGKPAGTGNEIQRRASQPSFPQGCQVLAHKPAPAVELRKRVVDERAVRVETHGNTSCPPIQMKANGTFQTNLTPPRGSVIQLAQGSEDEEDDDYINIPALRRAVLFVDRLTLEELQEWIRRITRWMQLFGSYDGRRRRLERYYHIFSRQELARQMNQPYLYSRILSDEQLLRKNMGINSVRSTSSSFRRNLGESLSARGGGKTDMGRLLQYMKKFGGAGMLGFHNHPYRRIPTISKILDKMKTDPKRQSKRGPKFSIITIDRRQLPGGSLMDLNDDSVRRSFLGSYSRFRKMYGEHASEGVAVVKGDVPLKAIRSLRSFRDVPGSTELTSMIKGLLDRGSSEADPEVAAAWAWLIIRSFQFSYEINNCLIEAIAGAAGIVLIPDTIRRIRDRLRDELGVSVGDFIEFNQNTTSIIQQELGIGPIRPIRLFTGTEFGLPTQTLGGVGAALEIYYYMNHYTPLHHARGVYNRERHNPS